MTQADLFDIGLARRLRDKGAGEVAANNDHWLYVAREIAELEAGRKGTVTADDVRRMIDIEPLHQNAYGAIFRDKRFEFTGEYQQSSAVSRRGGMQRVWKLRRS